MSNIKYTQEEICNALTAVAQVKDLNEVRTLSTLKEYLPEYDEKMLDWRIGEFLRNARNGGYLRYRQLLSDLGYRFEVESLISRYSRICTAIDQLVEMGIDINEVPYTAKMSDYDISYMEKDLPIGITLANARWGRIGKAIESKLKEYDFSFEVRQQTAAKITAKILTDVANVTDLNAIPNKAIVKDYLPDYNPKYADVKIGIIIQNVRAGGYEAHHDLLERLGFKFNNIRTRHTSQDICNAIQELFDKGVNLNEVPAKAMMSDYIPEYKNNDIKIGLNLHYARIGKSGKEVIEKLKSLNYDFYKYKSRKEEIIFIIKQIAQYRNINKISDRAYVIDILPEYKGRLEDWCIGEFLKRMRTNPNPDYVDVLNSVGFAWHRKNVRHTEAELCQSIRTLCDMGIDLNSIPERDKMSKYIPSYINNDFGIGSLLNRARMNCVSDAVKDELAKHNFDFNPKVRTIPAKQKLMILERIANEGIDLNTIRDRNRLSDLIQLEDGQEDFAVGMWLRRARSGVGGDELLNGLEALGYKIAKTL